MMVSSFLYIFLVVTTIEVSTSFGIVPSSVVRSNTNAATSYYGLSQRSHLTVVLAATDDDTNNDATTDEKQKESSETATTTTSSSTEEEPPQQQKKKKKKKKAGQPPATPIIIDISKLDIRVGVIQKAWEHEEADKLFCEEIDIGEDDGPRQIASGLRAHYNVEDLEGQRVLVLANLKTRKLVGFPSHGMVLCASSAEDVVKFVEPPADAAIGDRIVVEGYDGEPASENQVIKKKMLNVIFPELRTDDDGIATYKGVALKTAAGGACQAEGVPNAEVS